MELSVNAIGVAGIALAVIAAFINPVLVEEKIRLGIEHVESISRGISSPKESIIPLLLLILFLCIIFLFADSDSIIYKTLLSSSFYKNIVIFGFSFSAMWVTLPFLIIGLLLMYSAITECDDDTIELFIPIKNLFISGFMYILMGKFLLDMGNGYESGSIIIIFTIFIIVYILVSLFFIFFLCSLMLIHWLLFALISLVRLCGLVRNGVLTGVSLLVALLSSFL